jgi:tetratricopeptide (TPR) repeat protein
MNSPRQEPKSTLNVFVSYSRKDEQFARRTVAALENRGIKAKIDTRDLPNLAEWRRELLHFIRSADAVVFIVSRNSIDSPLCQWEVSQVAVLNKRLAPVVLERVDDDRIIPETIASINYLFFDPPNDFEVQADKLAEGLRTDIQWVKEHTRIGEAARRWADRNRPSALLLRGAELEEAEEWAASRPHAAPEPTVLHHELIAASRRSAMRRQRIWVCGSVAVAVLAITLAGAAMWQRKVAIDAERLATAQKKTAEANFKVALDAANKNIAIVPGGLQSGKINLDLARTLLDTSNSTLGNLAEENDNLEIAEARMRLYDTFSETYLTIGDVHKALQSAELGQRIAAHLTEIDPKKTRQRDLANSYARIGDARAGGGDLVGALKEFRNSLEILRHLKPRKRAGEELLADVWRTHERIGDILQAQNALPEAQEHYEAMLAVAREGRQRSPSSNKWQLCESITREDIGDVLRARGDLDGALHHFVIMEEVAQELVARDPSVNRWQWTLSLGHERVGDIYLKKGDPLQALNKYRKFLEIVERLATIDPSHSLWQRGLAIAHERIGDALITHRDDRAALAEYETDRDIARRLAGKDPGNSAFKRDLAIANRKIGDALYAQGAYGVAREHYATYQAMAKELVASDPSNADWEMDLATSYQRLGDVLLALADASGALDMFSRCSITTWKPYDPRNLWPPPFGQLSDWPSRLQDYCRAKTQAAGIRANLQ